MSPMETFYEIFHEDSSYETLSLYWRQLRISTPFNAHFTEGTTLFGRLAFNQRALVRAVALATSSLTLRQAKCKLSNFVLYFYASLLSAVL